MPEHDILTIEEVAAYLRVSERTVYDWANKGEIPCGKIGTTWRFKRADIERWVDERLNARKREPPAGAIALRDILSKDRVIILHGRTKREALEEVIDRLASSPHVTRKDELAREIFQREELMSTGIGFQVAVPHVRLQSVTDLVMAVGISPHAIEDYESLDELPIRIICMVAARIDQHAHYLRTLAAVSGALKHPAIRQALLEARTAEEAYGVLTPR